MKEYMDHAIAELIEMKVRGKLPPGYRSEMYDIGHVHGIAIIRSDGELFKRSETLPDGLLTYDGLIIEAAREIVKDAWKHFLKKGI